MPPAPGTNVVGWEVGITSAAKSVCITSPSDPGEPQRDPPAGMGARGFERVGLAALLVLGLALRVLMAWRFRVDSDEPQHLHVVWAWTHGLLPYRDVFDNHMPLFHLLSAPVLLAVGERPTAILWMRFLMLPQWCAALFLTALIGRRLFAPRVGAWSAVLAGFYPLFFFCSLEYRPDVLWTVLWLSAILIAIDGAPSVRRGLALGLVLGTAAAVSLKTILLVGAFAIATGLTLWLVPAAALWSNAAERGFSPFDAEGNWR